MTKTNDERPGKRVEVEAIYEVVRDRICLLEYPPGMVLHEAKLASEFGVSRTPIRTVLQRLAFGALIETKDGVGTIVTSLSLDELRDIYEVRLKIAEMIGHLSPKSCTQDHVQEAELLRARAEVLARNFNSVEYWRINHDLHFLIGDLIGNRALKHMWDHFYFQAARSWYALAKGMPSEVSISLLDQLAEVCRALRAGDVVAVGYTERNYIAFGLRRVLRHYSHEASSNTEVSGPTEL